MDDILESQAEHHSAELGRKRFIRIGIIVNAAMAVVLLATEALFRNLDDFSITTPTFMVGYPIAAIYFTSLLIAR